MSRFAIALASLLLVATTAASPPNIVLVMTDDQGYGDFGFTGNPVVRTPHLDAMADRSTRLTRFYTSPVCTPTRASLMTGRHAQRTGAIDTFVGRARMHPDEITIAEMLRDAGYATGIFGKWHLGDNHPCRAIDQGFETALVHHGGGLGQPSDPIENERRYTDAIMFRDGEPVETEGYCTDVQFDAGIEFIETASAGERPFFAYIATNAPHGPFHDVPGERHAEIAAADLGPVLEGYIRDPAGDIDRTSRIFSMVENIDENMGRLFAALDRLDLTKDTLVVFLCDNGPEGRRFVGPFTGAKSEVREGGIRSVCLWHRPGTFAPADTGVLSAHIDLAPTLLDLASVAPPPEVEFDGRSIRPWLDDPAAPTPSDHRLVIQAHRGDAPVHGHQVAIFEGPWKLSHQTGFGRETMPEGVPWRLHDVVADPAEETDLADAHPEIVTRLRTHYDAWFDDVTAPRPHGSARPPIRIGTDHGGRTVLSKQNWNRTAGRSWGTQGFWPVEVSSATRADIEVVRQGTNSTSTATVQIGDLLVEGLFPEGSRKAWIRGVALPEGRHDLTAWAGRDRTQSPYQVIVHATQPNRRTITPPAPET